MKQIPIVLSVGLMLLFVSVAVDAKRSGHCQAVPVSTLAVDDLELTVRSVSVRDVLFDATLAPVQEGVPSKFVLRQAPLAQNQQVTGATYDPRTGEVDIPCVQYANATYWATMKLADDPNDLVFDVTGADLVRDLSGLTLALPLVTGDSLLAFQGDGTVKLDGIYNGVWQQDGNQLDVSVEGGVTSGDLQATSNGISGTFDHFGQTTNLQQVRPIETEVGLHGNRFRVSVDWQHTPSSSPQPAHPVGNGEDSALFWFSDDSNTEMLVRVIDSCQLNNNYWVFYSAATDVGFTMTVTDTGSGIQRQYANPVGMPFQPVTDTSAFATCP